MCSSSDAYVVYQDKDERLFGKCYSCDGWTDEADTKKYLEEGLTDVENQSTIKYTYSNTIGNTITTTLKNNYRGISKDTLSYFNIGITEDGTTIAFPYPNGSYKLRRLDKKEFYTQGDFSKSDMFGSNLFSSGSAQKITITEGEIDAMSVFEMMGKYPVVSVKSSSSAKRDLKAQHTYINSFDKIYLCFDGDEVGQKAMKEVAKLFDPNKVYHVKMDRYKDANEYLVNGAQKEFQALWWNAKRHRPKGVVSSFEELSKLLDKRDATTICEYPWPSIQDMSYGIREGEIVLWKAQTGVGKTEVLRSVEHKVLRDTDHNIAIIHLEEEERRSIAGLAGYELRKPAHLPDSGVSNEEIMEAYKTLVRRDDRTFYYTHFGSNDPGIILDTIRYLGGACNCKVIFLDHISMVVSGNADEEDERRKLDRITTDLATMCRELNFNLQLVTHVNDQGQTRGSRNTGKVADLICDLGREHTSSDPIDRNVTKLVIEKNRFGSRTGPGGLLYFDPETFLIQETTNEQLDDIRSGHVAF